MNGFLWPAALGLSVITGTGFVVTPRDKGPEPFDEKTVLPGDAPKKVKQLQSAWGLSHREKQVRTEGTDGVDRFYHFTLFLEPDGFYRFHYGARWTSGFVPPIPSPIPIDNATADGFNVSETGRYFLSGEILLLEPTETTRADIVDNRLVREKKIPNENRGYVVHLDGAKSLHIAGECATYQIEVICREHTNVWFPFRAELGKRWFGKEPR
jgi:hypothetical protein